MGDDLQYHFERLAREKNQLILENEALGRNLAHTAEQLERMSIQCDVWRSKFLASRYEVHKVCLKFSFRFRKRHLSPGENSLKGH